MAGRFAAISNAEGSNIGTSASGPGLSAQDSARAGDFRFYTELLNAADAEQVCRDEGGHLAAYKSQTEQVSTPAGHGHPALQPGCLIMCDHD